MRACDIDMTGDVWLYAPSDHKNKWRGQPKLIPLGPRAQAIVRPYLKLDTTAYLFCPRDSADWHIIRRAARSGLNRKTKAYPSEKRRVEKIKTQRRERRQRRSAGDRYDTASYRRAIQYGIERALRVGTAVATWHPHQLRHSKATEIRRQFGLEAAQVALGHASAEVTQVYAERNLHLAIDIARSCG